MRFTIRRLGNILGTYEGKTEADALDAAARDEGYKDFADVCILLTLTRDDYRVEYIKE